MKVEAWVFGWVFFFFGVTAPIYWFLSYDPTGTAALIMCAALGGLVTFYLGFTARRMPARPEDRPEADIAEGAGELGFFPPYSWWPLWTAMAMAVCTLGVAIGWWLFIIGAGFQAITVTGWVFEYYRKEHAH